MNSDSWQFTRRTHLILIPVDLIRLWRLRNKIVNEITDNKRELSLSDGNKISATSDSCVALSYYSSSWPIILKTACEEFKSRSKEQEEEYEEQEEATEDFSGIFNFPRLRLWII